jgi:hypothetical protein
MAFGETRRGAPVVFVVAAIVVISLVLVWVILASSFRSPSPSPPTSADLTERTIPSEIESEGASYWANNWQWPIYDFHPCTNDTAPAINCTSLAATLTPGSYYEFSFEIDNQASIPAVLVDLETNVNFSFASVPSQYCNGGGVPMTPGPTVAPHSTFTITMNLTMPAVPGNYNPDLTLVAVFGGCTSGTCSWGC